MKKRIPEGKYAGRTVTDVRKHARGLAPNCLRVRLAACQDERGRTLAAAWVDIPEAEYRPELIQGVVGYAVNQQEESPCGSPR